MLKQISLLLCAFLVLCSKGFGQEQNEAGQVARAEDPARQQDQQKHIPVFGGADEFAIQGGFEYYAPQPGFDRLNRDIDVQVARLALAAHYRSGSEFQLEGIALRTHGTSTQNTSASNPRQVPSNALALGAGPQIRWNFLQSSRYRIFVEAQADVILADRPFPNQGTVYDFFLRGGGGVAIRVSQSYWIEPAFHLGHISNGQCFCSENPTWQGDAISIAVRRSFVHEPEASGRSHVLFRNADENAWETGVEDYLPLPDLNRENGKVEDDIKTITISRAWHFPDRLEFQLRIMARATDRQPQEVAGFGPLLRWNFIDHRHWRLFTDGGLHVLQTGSPAFFIPTGGVGYNGFLLGGVGTGFRLGNSYWLESSVRWVHVTSGVGPGASNLLAWSGQGASLSLRHVSPEVGPARASSASAGGHNYFIGVAILGGAEAVPSQMNRR